MADIEKNPAKLRDSKYKSRVVQNFESDLALAADITKLNAERRIGKYSGSGKSDRYKKDLDLFEKIDPSKRDTIIRSRPWGWGNKKLRIDKDGAFIRERGRFRKTRKTLSRDAESGVVVSGFEQESFRKKTTESYRNGGLLAKNVTRKDGSYEENWELSNGGKLIRTKYQTSRIRDGGLFRSISENLSVADTNGYRTLTRKKGGLFKNEKVFETDENGENLNLVGRKNRIFSKYSQISKNRDFANVDIKHFGGLWSKSYSSRLDADGNAISKDMGARRKILSKRSLRYEKGQLESHVHTFGGSKLYKHSVDYTAGDGLKTIKKKLFGLTIYKDTVNLSEREAAANDLRKAEAEEHHALWKAEVAGREAAPKAPAGEEAARDSAIKVYAVPAPGTTMRLGTTSVLPMPPTKSGRFPFASGVVFPTAPAPSTHQRGSSATEPDAPKSALLAPSHQNSVEVDKIARPAPEEEEDEDVAFLKKSASPSPSRTASKSANAESHAFLGDWKPVSGGDEAEKRTSTSPSRTASRSADAESHAFLGDWKPVGRGDEAEKRTPTSPSRTASKSADAESQAFLGDWKPVGRSDEAEKTTPASREISVAGERAAVNIWAPSGTRRIGHYDTDGTDAASKRGLEPRNRGVASVADW
ncbi:hypothetical protein FY134_27420 (plasmid) [Agrobacterium fabrum]|uniref:hypothetical protein n=1 Tax=Agrobacterium fabrum TaxID=1176649 RepID=UPI0021D2C1C7|nr:hypothetical protein [Agrobacterium fabrum]UXT61422.1 hypothetical protein FY134_27420 [Agrobacterium fabrum]